MTWSFLIQACRMYFRWRTWTVGTEYVDATMWIGRHYKINSECTIYWFILAVKYFRVSLLCCEIYFAKVSPCHTFLLSMWLICKNNFLWKDFWSIFAKIFHHQNKRVNGIYGMIKIISNALLNYLYDALWIFENFQCIWCIKIILEIIIILSTFLQEFIGEELILANGNF